MNWIVTGASGFVGKSLIKELSKNKQNKIVAICRSQDSDKGEIEKLSNVKFVYCKLGNYQNLVEQLSGEKIDIFCHLAWEGATGKKRADYEIQMNNVKASVCAFKVSESIGCKKFMCAGTVSENLLNQIENLDVIPQNMIYAQAKYTLYEFLKIISHNSKTKLVWMQFSNVFGSGDKTENLISYTFKELIAGRIPEYGSGGQPYNFIYIEDLVNAIICLANGSLKKDRYFIGSEEVFLLREYLSVIPKIIGKNIQLGIGKRVDDGLIYKKEWFDITDLKRDTEYISKYRFEDGILKIYQEKYLE